MSEDKNVLYAFPFIETRAGSEIDKTKKCVYYRDSKIDGKNFRNRRFAQGDEYGVYRVRAIGGHYCGHHLISVKSKKTGEIVFFKELHLICFGEKKERSRGKMEWC